MQLAFGLTEGAIGSSFSFNEGEVLKISATYEFQNPQQETVTTQWTYNGFVINPSFTTTTIINGVSYRTYNFQVNNINGQIHRAVNSNEEIIELQGLTPQSDSVVEFEVSNSYNNL